MGMKTKLPAGKVGKLVSYVRQRGAVAAIPADLLDAVDKAIDAGHIERVIHGHNYVLRLAPRTNR
jgi:hypothetical protein